MSRGVTGEVHHVDAGYHIVGMKHPDAPDITVGKDVIATRSGRLSNGMTMPVLYYVRHGETDFNAEARLQGRRDTSSMRAAGEQAKECGDLLRDLFARDGRAADRFRLCGEPAQARARDHGNLARDARARSARPIASTIG